MYVVGVWVCVDVVTHTRPFFVCMGEVNGEGGGGGELAEEGGRLEIG